MLLHHPPTEYRVRNKTNLRVELREVVRVHDRPSDRVDLVQVVVEPNVGEHIPLDHLELVEPGQRPPVLKFHLRFLVWPPVSQPNHPTPAQPRTVTTAAKYRKNQATESVYSA